MIDSVDNEKLLDELVDLENEYFIAKSSRHGNKEEIKEKIIALLEKVVDSQSDKVQKELNVAQITQLSSLFSRIVKKIGLLFASTFDISLHGE